MEEALTFLKAAACSTRAAEASLSVGSYSEEEEDGPYFDLEFTAKKNYRNAQLTESTTTTSDVDDDDSDSISEHEEGEDEETELQFECTDENIQGIASSDDNELFFKGNLVTIEPSSVIVNDDANSEVMNGSKVPVFLLKLLLKLKKSKPISNEKSLSSSSCDEKINEDDDDNNVVVVEAENENNNINNNKVVGGGGGGVNKFFTVKFKLVHEVPLVSALFTRDNSSKEKLIRQESSTSSESSTHHDAHVAISTTSDDHDHQKKQQIIAKEVQKYLKMVKPFYVRVSKRYAERLKGSKCGAPAVSPPRAAEESTVKDTVSGGGLKQGINVGNNLQAGLRLVRKRLAKSRSASSASVEDVEAAVLPSPATVPVNRRDDSLLQVQDGIQGAIMHCKRSFNASQQDAESSCVMPISE